LIKYIKLLKSLQKSNETTTSTSTTACNYHYSTSAVGDKYKLSYLDSYSIGSHVRDGGFSEIYEGIEKSSDSPVIIKQIPKRKTKNWLMVHQKKYPAEVLLHKMCNCIDGVIQMREFYEQEHDWIIVMSKMKNCLDLFDYLESKQKGRLTEPEACNFFKQLVLINKDLLLHGVVHRDIKSEVKYFFYFLLFCPSLTKIDFCVESFG
jgi:serine/threonine protein kinase